MNLRDQVITRSGKHLHQPGLYRRVQYAPVLDQRVKLIENGIVEDGKAQDLRFCKRISGLCTGFRKRSKRTSVERSYTKV